MLASAVRSSACGGAASLQDGVRARGGLVGRGCACGPQLLRLPHEAQQLCRAADLELGEAHQMHAPLRVLERLNLGGGGSRRIGNAGRPVPTAAP